MKFTVIKKDSRTKARAGVIETPHGEIPTPVFLPVGSRGSIRTLTNEDLYELDIKIFVANIYHLHFRPGIDVIKSIGGIHKFINWRNAILIDSGGYQIFSLSGTVKVLDDGVEFTYPIDGSRHFFTPEMAIQESLLIGGDIIMCFDECVGYPAEYEYINSAVERTTRWAERCKKAFEDKKDKNSQQGLLGIVQGGTYQELRKKSLHGLLSIGFDGYAIGGLGVGESKDTMYNIVSFTCDLLPEENIRYLMGIGAPEDIWRCVEYGVDVFDCVLPTRNARNGQVFTTTGKINLRNSSLRTDFRPLDERCGCVVCKNYTRAYISHLIRADELTGLRLATLHNVYFMSSLMKRIRESILEGRFSEERGMFLSRYLGTGENCG
jgi:queuine tRNA-ribosyltransferase